MIDAQWKSWEEELRKEMLQEIECHKSHLQQKEGKWAEKNLFEMGTLLYSVNHF